MESPSRQRFESPAHEAGLAEWTKRIKALQRDVDADEEAEQRKLEEEIRASRSARSRRSGGAQFEGRLPSNVLQEESHVTTDRISGQADALRKLTGEDTSPSAADPSLSSAMDRKPSTSASLAAEPMSLAAFMGGKATGPRLNRPAAQADAHNPALFEQRTLADITAPHPVFGSGGIALPGLADKGKMVIDQKRTEKLHISGNKSAARTKPANVPTITPTTPLKASVRERTLSTPTSFVPPKSVERHSPSIPSGSPGVRNRVESLYAQANKSSERIKTPTLRSSKSSDRVASRPAAPAKPDSLRKPQALASISPTVLSSPTVSSSPRSHAPTSRSLSTSSPVTTPSLARPVQPSPRPTSTGPQVPLGKAPAPAFLKPPQQKDLTPSLSRLQGRGFVQSFVKLSGEIEAAAGYSPERSTSPKRNNLADRWNPPQTPSPNVSPIPAPQMRKAKTVDTPISPSPEISQGPSKSRPPPPPKTARSHSHSASVKSTSLSKVTATAPGDGLPLGSSNTLISYIKTNKTGEAPPTNGDEPPRRSKTPSRHTDAHEHNIDEMGIRSRSSRSRSRSRGSSRGGPSPTPSGKSKRDSKSDLTSVAPSGRSLNHPTKDRARLRRKGAGIQVSGKSPIAEAQLSLPEVEAVSDAKTSVRKPCGTPAQAELAQVEHSILIPAENPDALPKSPTIARGENIRRLQSTWSNQGPVATQAQPKPQSTLPSPSPSRSSFNTRLDEPKLTRQALPGLAKVQPLQQQETAPLSPPATPPLTTRQERKASPSPVRHGRIPSTGNRPTVMDVAQAFYETPPTSPPASILKTSPFPISPNIPVTLHPSSSQDQESDIRTETNPGGWGEDENERTITPAVIKAERRRSTMEKYSSFTLPVLEEEKTPLSTPSGTLKRVEQDDIEAANEGLEVTEKGIELEEPSMQVAGRTAIPTMMRVEFIDEPLPAVNSSKLWDSNSSHFRANPDLRTVSVEVKLVEGSSAKDVPRGLNNVFVFYDTEVLAIVHRAKSRSSGLVQTKVWEWVGRKAEFGEKEREKSIELAKRYGTERVRVEQYAEAQELVHVLGGVLITRQGKRSLWSSDNTTMHCIRSVAGLIFIDEVDLSIKNLCSGFSFCISVLENLWVWYGCGSSSAERSAALQYAQALTSTSPESEPSTMEKTILELEEGKEDEMLSMFLGEDGYASASYWKWRKNERGGTSPRFFEVNCGSKGSEITELGTFPSPTQVRRSILIAHLAYEIFILVGQDARDKRHDIRLALTITQEFSTHTAKTKPFEPPVHTLIFPSQIPLDLKAALRGLDEDVIHGSEEVPEHMHLLTIEAAWTQLHRKEWDMADFEDGNMLPLGMGRKPT